MTPQEIQAQLPYFTGTEKYHRYSPLFPNVLLTDGAKFVAEACGAYWLMDMICSHLSSLKRAKETFAVAVLSKVAHYHGGGWSFSLVDDIPSSITYARQGVEFSDFPFDDFKLYVAYDGEHWVIMLPSEY